MTDVRVAAPGGDLSAYVARPEGAGRWPGVVVIHDAVGMTQDLRHQADWLARDGFLAAAPDLFDGHTMLRCVQSIMRDVRTGSGRSFDGIDAVREWLIQQDDCTGQIGVIGFCLGGGFALMLAPAHGYAAASVNYGALPTDAERSLANACPIVASYGARDRSLRGSAEKLEGILTRNGIDHDVKQYPDAGHGFLNDHAPGEVPKLFAAMGRYARTAYHEPSARDARRRITAFFTEHLIRP